MTYIPIYFHLDCFLLILTFQLLTLTMYLFPGKCFLGLEKQLLISRRPYLANKYLLKVSNRNPKTRREIS